MRDPKGRVHSVAPTYGSATVPAPAPPVQNASGPPARVAGR